MLTALKIAVISDSHDLWRPELDHILQNVDHIWHAGDVGRPDWLERLNRYAPTVVVRGNTDPARYGYPTTAYAELAGVGVYMLHNLDDLDLMPQDAGIGIVIYGHTHTPKAERKDGVLYLNPGAIGAKRGFLPVRCCYLHLPSGDIEWVTISS